MQQYLLSQPEMRDFLQSRPMVPYKEPWMAQVDTMKTLQGWSDITVTHFRDLGTYGEQILLSIRYGDWIDINDEEPAKNWARYWRPEIQSYIHAYRTVTGVDLTNPDTVDYTIPAVHLQKAASVAAGAVRCPPVLDFTSALYLGLRHPSSSLRPGRAHDGQARGAGADGRAAPSLPPGLPRWWAASVQRRLPRRCISSGTCSECSHVTGEDLHGRGNVRDCALGRRASRGAGCTCATSFRITTPPPSRG